MTAVHKELYDALVAAGAPEDKASAAAATVQLADDLAPKSDLRAEISALKAEIYRALLAQTLMLIAAMVGLKLFG